MADVRKQADVRSGFEFRGCLKLLNVMVLTAVMGFYVAVGTRLRDNLVYRQLCNHSFGDGYMFCFVPSEGLNVTEDDIRMLHLIHSASDHVFLTLSLRTLAEFVSAGLLCPWSDACGRRAPLLLALLGLNVETAHYFVTEAPYDTFVWSFHVVEVASGLFGGFTCIYCMTYCYLVDHTSPQYRTLFFTFLEVFSVAGVLAGVVTFKRVFVENSSLVIGATLLAVRLASLLWVWLTLAEGDRFPLRQESLLGRLRALFSLDNYKNTLDALTKWRPSCGREQLHLLAVSVLACMISYSIIESIIFSKLFKSIFFRDFEEYHHMLLYYTVYCSLSEALVISVLHFFPPWGKDSTLGVIGVAQEYISAFIRAYSRDYFTYLMGLIVTPLKNFTSIALRSSYSKIAEEEDLGKLFFVFSFCETAATTLFSYFLYQKLRYIFITNHEELLSHMLVAAGVVVALGTFTFQKMSVETDHLFKPCWRRVSHNSIESFSRYRDSLHESDAKI